MEVQADLGLAAPPRSARSAPVLPPLEDVSGEPADTPPAARRSQLPNIEQINSTLRSDAERTASTVDTDASADIGDGTRASGFRFGFVFVIAVTVFLVVLDAQAARIAAAVPALSGPLNGYTALVDRAQAALNGLVDQITGTP